MKGTLLIVGVLTACVVAPSVQSVRESRPVLTRLRKVPSKLPSCSVGGMQTVPLYEALRSPTSLGRHAVVALVAKDSPNSRILEYHLLEFSSLRSELLAKVVHQNGDQGKGNEVDKDAV